MANTQLGVVIPVYNAEEFLPQCIESILNQTYEDFNLVIVNDGSTDNSGQICDVYAKKDKRVSVIHQMNHGKLVARYIGAKQIDSEYLTFVDADDWIDVNTYKYMKKYMDEGIQMISFAIVRWHDESYQYINTNDYVEGHFVNEEKEKFWSSMIWNIEKNKFNIDPSLCNKIIRRELLLAELKKAHRLNISYGDDVAVVFPLMKNISDFIETNIPLYYHRQRKRNIIPEYFSDRYFYSKLSDLYDYLAEEFDYKECIVKQLDYFFYKSAGYRLWNYGTNRIKNRYQYMFPFERVKKGSNIVIYGASEVGQEYVEQVNRTNYANIILWVDRNYTHYTGLNVVSPDCIKEFTGYDFVIVAVSNIDLSRNIANYIESLGVSNNKIVYYC